MKRLKIDGKFLDVDGYIPEFDDIEVNKNNIKLFRNGSMIVHFEGCKDMNLYTIVNNDGTETPLLKQEDSKDSNLELLNSEMLQASVKYELQDLHENNNIVEEKASVTLDNINNKLEEMNNKDNQYKEDINSINDSIKLMLEKFDNRFSQLEKDIVSLNNSIYTINNRLKAVEGAK